MAEKGRRITRRGTCGFRIARSMSRCAGRGGKSSTSLIAGGYQSGLDLIKRCDDGNRLASELRSLRTAQPRGHRPICALNIADRELRLPRGEY